MTTQVIGRRESGKEAGKRGWCIVVGVVFTLIVLVALFWSSIAKIIIQEILRSSRASGARIAWSGLEVSGTTVSAESLETWIPGPAARGGIRVPISLEMNHLNATIFPSALLTGSLRGTFSSQAYGGIIRGDGSWDRTTPLGTGSLSGINLSLHPQIRALGVTSGVLNGIIQEGIWKPFPDTKAAFSVTVDQLEIPSLPALVELALSSQTGGIGSILKVPPLTGGSLKLEGTVDGGAVTLPTVQLTSSLGKIDGHLTFSSASAGHRGSCEGEAVISLSDGTASSLKQWLPLISNNAVPATANQFVVKLTGTECARANMTELYIGGVCVRARFELPH